MASILQNVFARALREEHVKKVKSFLSHVSLYMGICVYTALGAKVGYHYIVDVKILQMNGKNRLQNGNEIFFKKFKILLN